MCYKLHKEFTLCKYREQEFRRCSSSFENNGKRRKKKGNWFQKLFCSSPPERDCPCVSLNQRLTDCCSDCTMKRETQRKKDDEARRREQAVLFEEGRQQYEKWNADKKARRQEEAKRFNFQCSLCQAEGRPLRPDERNTKINRGLCCSRGVDEYEAADGKEGRSGRSIVPRFQHPTVTDSPAAPPPRREERHPRAIKRKSLPENHPRLQESLPPLPPLQERQEQERQAPLLQRRPAIKRDHAPYRDKNLARQALEGRGRPQRHSPLQEISQEIQAQETAQERQVQKKHVRFRESRPPQRMSSTQAARSEARAASKRYGWEEDPRYSADINPALAREWVNLPGESVKSGMYPGTPTSPKYSGMYPGTLASTKYQEPGIDWKRWDQAPQSPHGRYPPAAPAPKQPLPQPALRNKRGEVWKDSRALMSGGRGDDEGGHPVSPLSPQPRHGPASPVSPLETTKWDLPPRPLKSMASSLGDSIDDALEYWKKE
jgi:hypothetical protein